jgi:thiamine-phosphate pyrophosphorylase
MTTEALRFPSGLYGVTPDWSDAERINDAISQAAAGGMRTLQLRNKTMQGQALRTLAQRVRDHCASLGVFFIMNDQWRIAMEVGADGVHLGKDDESASVVREAVGSRLLIGVSCYADLHRAKSSLASDVDYIAFGAMFVSGTKPQAPPAPLSVLTEARALAQQTQAPARPAVCAIGGIVPERVHSLAAAGADCVAVVGGLFLAKDIEAAARALSSPWVQ